MKYIYLIYENESLWTGLSSGETDAIMNEYAAFSEGLEKNGQVLASEALDPVHTATTVRVRQGKVSMTDGPFAETKEQLGAFYIVEAKDLNEAIQIASRIPTARTGCVEIRPVTVFPTA